MSRTFRLTPRLELEGVAEAFNITNRQNVVTRNTNFGAGAYPDNPCAEIRPAHRGRRTPLGAAGCAAAILIGRYDLRPPPRDAVLLEAATRGCSPRSFLQQGQEIGEKQIGFAS